MNLNLILPPSPWLISDTDLPFLGILYLSKYLKNHGINVTVTDLSGQNLDRWWPDKHYSYYGITGTSPNFPQIREIANRIRIVNPKAKIVAGGPHATLAYRHLLTYSAVDACIIGPGEERILDYLNGKVTDGIAYKNNGRIDYMPKAGIDKGLVSVPDYGAIDFSKYLPSQTFKYILGEVNEATLLTTIGCPWRCRFCAQHRMRNGIYYIPLDHISQNIDVLKNEYKVELFYILDDTFGFNIPRFEAICDLFKQKKINWHCLLRAELATKEKLSAMKASGCLGVVYGFESGSDRILNAMNKKTTAYQNYVAASLTRESGMAVRGQLIVGFPGEDDDSVNETRDFIRYSEVTVFGIHTFQPFPGSDVWENPEKYNVSVNKDTDFSNWHTIGKPDQIAGSNKVKKWIDILRNEAGEKNIERICE